MDQSHLLDLVEVADQPGPLTERGRELLNGLRRLVDFDAAWLALADPVGRGYTSLASTDLDAAALRSLSGSEARNGLMMVRPEGSVGGSGSLASRHQSPDLPVWAGFAGLTGFRTALTAPLFCKGRRRVGFLALLSSGVHPPTMETRNRLSSLIPVLARGIDPLRHLTAATHVVRDATYGAVLCADGSTRRLPGLDQHELLQEGSALVDLARSTLSDEQNFTSSLWPCPGPDAPLGQIRVSVLADGAGPSTGFLGSIVLSPRADLRGLTSRELEVLGLLVEGCSNQQIAHALVVAPRTVATHLEHVLDKLDAPTRTLAAIRAEREGLYIPSIATCGLGLNRIGGVSRTKRRTSTI